MGRESSRDVLGQEESPLLGQEHDEEDEFTSPNRVSTDMTKIRRWGPLHIPAVRSFRYAPFTASRAHVRRRERGQPISRGTPMGVDPLRARRVSRAVPEEVNERRFAQPYAWGALAAWWAVGGIAAYVRRYFWKASARASSGRPTPP